MATLAFSPESMFGQGVLPGHAHTTANRLLDLSVKTLGMLQSVPYRIELNRLYVNTLLSCPASVSDQSVADLNIPEASTTVRLTFAILVLRSWGT